MVLRPSALFNPKSLPDFHAAKTIAMRTNSLLAKHLSPEASLVPTLW